VVIIAFTEWCRVCKHFEVSEHGTICHATNEPEKFDWYKKCPKFKRIWIKTIGYILTGDEVVKRNLLRWFS
jgi:hypothetical protein